MSDEEMMTQGGDQDGACAECSQSPAVLSRPSAQAELTIKMGFKFKYVCCDLWGKHLAETLTAHSSSHFALNFAHLALALARALSHTLSPTCSLPRYLRLPPPLSPSLPPPLSRAVSVSRSLALPPSHLPAFLNVLHLHHLLAHWRKPGTGVPSVSLPLAFRWPSVSLPSPSRTLTPRPHTTQTKDAVTDSWMYDLLSALPNCTCKPNLLARCI